MFGIIGNFGPWELVMILAIVLIVIGPGKLPQVGQSMGAAMKNFKRAQQDAFLEDEHDQ